MKLYKYKSLPHKKELTAEEKEQLEYCKDILLNEFLLKVVNYVADHFGNLPDNSKPGFENFTNDEFDTAVKYLAEIGVLKLNQSKDFSYCGRRDIETNDDYEEYYVTKAFISEENLKKFKASLEQ